MPWRWDDGGRSDFFKGKDVGDCVVRSIAIASGRSYEEIYHECNELAAERERPRRSGRKGSSARDGVNVTRAWFKRWMLELGFVWTPTMGIGTGCRVHLARGELPEGRLVVNVSKHITAVVDGVVRDLYDPGRDGTRCVYGYWKLEEEKA